MRARDPNERLRPSGLRNEFDVGWGERSEPHQRNVGLPGRLVGLALLGPPYESRHKSASLKNATRPRLRLDRVVLH